MDVTPFLELRIAPRAVFERLPEREHQPRFHVPQKDGTWRPVTWGAFARQIRELACFLRAEGLEAGDRVAVFAANRVEWASAALAIQAAGGVMVPIYPASTAAQAAYVLAHGDAKFVFVDGKRIAATVAEAMGTEEGLPALKAMITLDDALERPGSVPESKFVAWNTAVVRGAAWDRANPSGFQQGMDAIDLDQPGIMLYTSGTSGNPKGVMLTHRNVAVNGRDWLECNASVLEENAVDVLWLPMSHIFGLGEMCLGNSLGFTTYLSDPASALERLPEIRPNVFMSVPSHWEKLAVMSGGDPEKLKTITGGRMSFCLSGGAGLKREVKELFHRAGMLVIEGYGLTECSPTLTLNRPSAFRFDTVGLPLPSVELKLAEDGEILAKGPNVFKGYHKDPDATREAFDEDGWFKTGDVGRFTEDGFLQIVDRKKDILVTAGGKNVPPANIEVRFRDDPNIGHVVVYGDAKKFLVAGVWLRDGVANDATTLAKVQASIDAVNAQLASYETIKKFVVIDSPLTVEAELLTASLKVRRKQVYERFRSAFEALYA